MGKVITTIVKRSEVEQRVMALSALDPYLLSLSREPKLLPLFNLFFKKEDPVRLAFCATSKMAAPGDPGDPKCALARV